MLVENENGGKHAEDVAERYHGVGHGEGEMLDDIEPQGGGAEEVDAAGEEPPVGEGAHEEIDCPREGSCALQGKLQQYLTAAEKYGLDDGNEEEAHRGVRVFGV